MTKLHGNKNGKMTKLQGGKMASQNGKATE